MQQVLHPEHGKHLKRFDVWTPEGAPIKRVSEVRKSYDCSLPSARHLCMHSAKAQHGFRFEEWWYGLKKGPYGLSTGICCPQDSPDVPPAYRCYVGAPPMALHTAVFVALLDADGKPLKPPLDMKGIPQGKWTETLYKSDAKDLVSYAEPTYEQPESFWQALEEKLQDILSQHQSTHAN